MTLQETLRQAYPIYSFLENLGFLNLLLLFVILTSVVTVISLKVKKLKFYGNKDEVARNKAFDVVAKTIIGAVFAFIFTMLAVSQTTIGVKGQFLGDEYVRLESGFDNLTKILSSDFKIEAKRYEGSNRDFYLLEKPEAVLTDSRLGQIVTLHRPALRMLLTEEEVKALEQQAANNPTLLSRLQLKVENNVVVR